MRVVTPEGRLAYAAWPERELVLGMTDILKTDAVEAEFLTGTADIREAARILAALGPREIVLTHKDGLLVLANGTLPRGGLPPGRAARAQRPRRHLRRVLRVETDLGGTRRGDALGRRAHEPQARGGRPDPAQPRGRRAPDPGTLLMRRRAALAALLLVAGCASQPAAKSPIAEFLAFGDSGYHYDYLEFDDEPGPKTLEAFVEAERLDWLEDKRPPAEFRPPPAYRVPETGSFIAASGQAAVATAMRRFCEGPPACEFARHARRQHLSRRRDRGRGRARRRRALPQDLPRTLRAARRQRPTDFRIYAALGNHDWKTSRAGAMAQVRYLTETRPFYMDGIRYRVAPTGDPREVEIFVLDTHVMLSAYSILDDALDDDAREIDSDEIDATQPWAVPHTEDEWRMARVARGVPRLVARRAGRS